MAITIKQGDTRHAIRAKLISLNGQSIDLTEANVRFKLADRNNVVLIDREASVIEGGIVEFIFNSGETDISGVHAAEFFVTYADYRVETFPHRGKLKIMIEPRIGGV